MWLCCVSLYVSPSHPFVRRMRHPTHNISSQIDNPTSLENVEAKVCHASVRNLTLNQTMP